MGINFKKSKKILPGVRINLSKNGVGATFGGKAGRISLSPKGASAGFSVPGTGLSYNKRLSTSGKSTGNASRNGADQGAVFDADEIAAHASQVFDNNSVTPPPSQKHCTYCDSPVPEDALECPSCGSKDFAYRCPQCGTTGTSPYCTTCLNEQQAEKERFIASAVREAEDTVKTQKAQSGVWWKVLLTLFVPFIGGYFLITPYSYKAHRVVGAAWCAICALGVAALSAEAVSTKVVSVILCLLPIAVYLCRLSLNQVEQEASNMKKYWIGLAVILVVALAMCVFGCGSSNTGTENNQQQEQSTAPAAVEAENQYAEDDVVEEFVLAYNALSESPFKELEKGNIRTKYHGESYGHSVQLLDSAATDKIIVTIYGKNQKVGVSKAKQLFVDAVRAIDPSITEKEAEKRFASVIKDDYTTKPFGKKLEIECYPDGGFGGNGWIEIAAV